jgi:hypothetical protein
MFFDADQLIEWLQQVITPAETARLRQFLGDDVAVLKRVAR